MEKGVVLKNFQDGSMTIDTLHLKAEATHCNEQRCVGSIVIPDEQKLGEPETLSKVKEEALNFLEEYFQSIQCVNSPQSRERIAEVVKEIDKCGSYELTEKELTYGARLAWRNASRCIGRIQWKKLHVFDCRHVTNTQQMFECCLQHLRFATNKGNIRAAISVFPQRRNNHGDFRIWNAQLIRYAGYKQDDGTVIGDPSSVEITKIAESLGWVGKGTKFDILPLIMQANGENPELFEIPKDYVLEVNIQHPTYRELDQLGLRWYAIPVISSMALSCGGLTFPAIPFNGWYMSTEISVRNFGDENRYNLLKPTAKLLGCNTSTHISLWKDRAIIELTTAILHSYQTAGVTMVDHHSSAESFMKHFHQENKLRGGCPSDWVWIVPPLSGSTCPVFHQEMLNYKLKPAYEYQTDPWKNSKTVLNQLDVVKKRKFKQLANFVKLSTDLMSNVVAKRHKITILYASETGKAEAFAYTLHELFLNAFNSKVVCMDQYKLDQLENEKCIFVVASTSGNGEAPENGEAFGRKLYEMVYPSDKAIAMSGIHHPQNKEIPSLNENIPILFSVFGLGSKAYPYFCAFAKSLKKLLKAVGGEEIYPIGEGDELCGQEQAFKAWSQGCFKATCEAFSIQTQNQSKLSPQISTDDFRIVFPESFIINSLHKELKKFHRKVIETCKIISVSNLQTNKSNRVTNLVRIDKLCNKELSYCPGDNLGIYACNNMELVDRLISHLTNNKLTSSTVVDLVMNEDPKKLDGVFSKNQLSLWKRLPLPNTLGRIFGWFLDITTPPSMKLLGVFASKCKNQKEKAMLMKLARISNSYEDWKHSSYPSIVDVLEEFSSIEIDFVLLANELPLLKPRYYSISSSPDVYPNEIHITVALVSYSINEIPHNGVCSSWLHSRKAGSEVYCFIRKTPAFQMPSHPATPIIMVGPGTGIAPFRSFWQQRMFDMSHQNEVFGEMFLFFGCRNKYQDNIYGSELEDAKHQGALTEVFVGCSRQPEEQKTYVQDLLKANSKLVLEYFLKKEGHIYVCGDVTMASDVQKAMLGMIKESLKCSEQECKNLIYDIKKNGRYHEEIFGVTLNIRHVTSRVRSVLNRYKEIKEPCKSRDEKIKFRQIHSANKIT